MKNLSKKKLIVRKGLVFIFILLFLAVLFRHLLLTSWIVSAATKATGCQVSIEKLNLDMFHSRIYMRNVTLLNSKEFDNKKILGSAGEILIQYNLFGWIAGKAPLEYVKADIRELNIIRNKEGNLNIFSHKQNRALSGNKQVSAEPCAMPMAGDRSGDTMYNERRHSAVFSPELELITGQSQSIDRPNNTCKAGGNDGQPKFIIKRLEILLKEARFIDYKTPDNIAREIIFTAEKPCVFKNVGSLGGVLDTLLKKGSK
ncbi:MAG: hypothetical protein V1662_05365 [Candidatus Omnitrophota bacterium]